MIRNKSIVGAFMLLHILFFSCENKNDSKRNDSLIRYEELKFALPDDSYYPSEAISLNNSFYFLDFKGQRIMKYDSQSSRPIIWDINKFNFDKKLNFNLLFRYFNDQLFLYSSMSKKALTLKDDFSEPRLIDLTWLEKDLIFTSGGNLLFDKESIILPAISYENNEMILSVIKIEPFKQDFFELARFTEALDPYIPSMFYHPHITKFEGDFFLYFPTLSQPIKFNSENKLIEKEFLTKELLDKFDYEKNSKHPLYFYEFSFFYYTAFSDKKLIRLKNEGLDADTKKPNTVLQISEFNQSPFASIVIPDSLFHKSVFTESDSFFFLNQILTNKKEDFIYLNKISMD